MWNWTGQTDPLLWRAVPLFMSKGWQSVIAASICKRFLNFRFLPLTALIHSSWQKEGCMFNTRLITDPLKMEVFKYSRRKVTHGGIGSKVRYDSVQNFSFCLLVWQLRTQYRSVILPVVFTGVQLGVWCQGENTDRVFNRVFRRSSGPKRHKKSGMVKTA